MVKDLFIIDTRCHLNRSIEKAFVKKGYEVKVRRSYRIKGCRKKYCFIDYTFASLPF